VALTFDHGSKITALFTISSMMPCCVFVFSTCSPCYGGQKRSVAVWFKGGITRTEQQGKFALY